ncbi:MAG: hypothetical protein JWN94_3227 [Betaproteobacteria bacterium]|nr:hypothetical protein [Betaproteobacteria bacterium]
MQTLTLRSDGDDARRLQRFGWLDRLGDVNWYQVAVVALTAFAVSMVVMFPPCRVPLGNGLTVYAGHVFWSPSVRALAQVDFLCLGVELAAILVIAIVGWKLGFVDRRLTKR